MVSFQKGTDYGCGGRYRLVTAEKKRQNAMRDKSLTVRKERRGEGSGEQSRRKPAGVLAPKGESGKGGASRVRKGANGWPGEKIQRFVVEKIIRRVARRGQRA